MNTNPNQHLFTLPARRYKKAIGTTLLIALSYTANAQPVLMDDVYFTGAVRSNTGSLAVHGINGTASLLRFRPSVGMPVGLTAANIAKATLKLYVQRVTKTGKFTVHSVLAYPCLDRNRRNRCSGLGFGHHCAGCCYPAIKT